MSVSSSISPVVPPISSGSPQKTTLKDGYMFVLENGYLTVLNAPNPKANSNNVIASVKVDNAIDMAVRSRTNGENMIAILNKDGSIAVYNFYENNLAPVANGVAWPSKPHPYPVSVSFSNDNKYLIVTYGNEMMVTEIDSNGLLLVPQWIPTPGGGTYKSTSSGLANVAAFLLIVLLIILIVIAILFFMAMAKIASVVSEI